MPLSEREQRALEQLEAEFRASASAASSAAPSWWSNIGFAKRTAAAAVALPVGTFLMILGLVLNSAAGIVLAVVGYLSLVVVGLAIFLDGVPRARTALGRQSQSRPASHPPRSFR